ILLGTFSAAVFAACVDTTPTKHGVEQTDSNLHTVDQDGDGIPDCIDVDNDGQCTSADQPLSPPMCLPAPIDDDGDGIPDGVDLDCDGVIDVPGNNNCVPAAIDDDGDGIPD